MNKPFNFIKNTILFVCITLCFSFLVGCNAVVCEHIESNWIVDTEPSIYNEGSQHKECTKCGEILSTELIPKLCSHIESNWIIDINATLQSEGAKHTECTKCGEIIQTQTIPELEYSLSEVKQILSERF